MSRFFEKQALGLDGTIVRHHKRWCVEFDPAIAAAFETPKPSMMVGVQNPNVGFQLVKQN